MAWLVCIVSCDNRERLDALDIFLSEIYENYETLDIEDRLDEFSGKFYEALASYGGELERFVSNRWPLPNFPPDDFVSQAIPERAGDRILQVLFHGIEGFTKRIDYRQDYVDCAVAFLSAAGVDVSIMDDKVARAAERVANGILGESLLEAIVGGATASEIVEALRE